MLNLKTSDFENWNLPIKKIESQFNIIELIGEGAFSKVYKA